MWIMIAISRNKIYIFPKFKPYIVFVDQTNLTWANNAFAITSNMDAKTRILILACNSADNPLNNSKTLALAFAPASWYLKIESRMFN